MKTHFAKPLPPYLVLVSVLVMAGLRFLVPVEILVWFPFNLLGVLFFFAGLAISLWSSRKFKRVGTNINTFYEPGVLVTDGPFRYTRNPMYLGFALLLIGVSVLFGAFTSFLVPLVFILITNRWYIQFEERWMMDKFGHQYDDYRRKTRRWL